REAVVVNNAGTEQVQISTVNGQSLNGSTTFMVNVPRTMAQQFKPDTTFCECDYTRWGFWSTDSNRNAANGATESDRGHLLTWVAGRLPNVNEVPTAGSATYVGHVVANVRNAGNEYVTGANLINTVDFARRAGTANVTDFDGVNYAGTLQLNNSDP